MEMRQRAQEKVNNAAADERARAGEVYDSWIRCFQQHPSTPAHAVVVNDNFRDSSARNAFSSSSSSIHSSKTL